MVWHSKPLNTDMVDMNLFMPTKQPLSAHHLVGSRRNERLQSFLLAVSALGYCLLLVVATKRIERLAHKQEFNASMGLARTFVKNCCFALFT